MHCWGNWLRFFADETAEEFSMIVQTSPAIAEAWGVVQYLSGDEEARRLAEYEKMSRRDEADRQKDAYKQGRQAAIIEVARNLLQDKMPADAVSKAAGLSLDKINRLVADRT
jgi:predicted transposase/invertase (TIGR01784 family)